MMLIPVARQVIIDIIFMIGSSTDLTRRSTNLLLLPAVSYISA